MKKSPVANMRSSTKKTGWELEGLKGKVKEHAMTLYDIRNKAGKDVKEISIKAVFKYNKKGNRTEGAYFDADGVLMKKYIARYDGRCNQTEGAWYNADGSLFRKDVFKYNGNDNKIERANYNADEVLLNRTIYKFDANGKPTEGILCNMDGSLKVKGVYKYDASGKLLEIEHYKADGSANSKISFMNDIKKNREKDEMGNTIEEARYDQKGNLTKISTSSYTYYSSEGVSK